MLCVLTGNILSGGRSFKKWAFPRVFIIMKIFISCQCSGPFDTLLESCYVGAATVHQFLQSAWSYFKGSDLGSRQGKFMAAQLADLLSKARLPALQLGPLLSSLRAPRTENNFTARWFINQKGCGFKVALG